MGISKLNSTSKEQAMEAMLATALIAGEARNSLLDYRDLRAIKELSGYSYESVVQAMSELISTAAKKITVQNVLDASELSGVNSLSNGYSTAEHFEDVFLYLVYKDAIDTSAARTDFWTVAGGVASTGSAYDKFQTILMGFVTNGVKGKWFSDITGYSLPAASFRVEINDALVNSKLVAKDVTSTDDSVSFYKVSAPGFGITNLNDIILRIAKNGSEAYPGLTASDFPVQLTARQAITYITGIDALSDPATNPDLTDLTTKQLDQIMDLNFSKQGGTLAYYKTLQNVASSSIPGYVIFNSTNASIKRELSEMDDDELWTYIPVDQDQGLVRNFTRPMTSDEGSDLWKYSNQVQMVDLFAKTKKYSVSDLTDKFTGKGMFTKLDTNGDLYNALASEVDNDRTADAIQADLSTDSTVEDFVAMNVLSAWRHYKKTAAIDYSKLVDADSIARFISDDFLKPVSNESVDFELTDANSGLNDADGLWYKFLTQCKSGTVKPTRDINVIYEALLMLATMKRQDLESSDSATSGVNIWLGTDADNYIVRTDAPSSGATPSASASDQDLFWGTQDSYNVDNEDNGKLRLALYILDDAPVGGQFELLGEPKNDSFFKKLVKTGVAIDSVTKLPKQQVLYGLNTTVTVTAAGAPASNFGGRAYEVLKTYNINESLKVALYAHQVGGGNGRADNYAELKNMAKEFTLAKLVNLKVMPVQKNGDEIFEPAVDNFYENKPAANQVYPNTNDSSAMREKLKVVAAMVDIAIGVKLDNRVIQNSNVDFNADSFTFDSLDQSPDTAVAEPQMISAKNILQVVEVLGLLEEDSVKDFLNIHVEYDDTNRAIAEMLFASMIYYRHTNGSYFGKYGSSNLWAKAIQGAAVDTFNGAWVWDLATENSDVNHEGAQFSLTLSKSNMAKRIADLIHYQINTKNISQGSYGDVQKTLKDYVDLLINGRKDLQRGLILGLVVARTNGKTSYIIGKSEYDELVAAGMDQNDILNMVVARQGVKGHVVGKVTYYTLVARDDEGEPVFDEL